MNRPPSAMPRPAHPELAAELLEVVSEETATTMQLDLALYELAGTPNPNRRVVTQLAAQRLRLSGGPLDDTLHERSEDLCYLAALAWATGTAVLLEEEEPVEGDWAQTVTAALARAWTALARQRPGDVDHILGHLYHRQETEAAQYLDQAGQASVQRVGREILLHALYAHVNAVANVSRDLYSQALDSLGMARVAADQLGSADTGVARLASELGALVAFYSGLRADGEPIVASAPPAPLKVMPQPDLDPSSIDAELSPAFDV